MYNLIYKHSRVGTKLPERDSNLVSHVQFQCDFRTSDLQTDRDAGMEYSP